MFLDNSIVLDKFPIISIYKVLTEKNRDTDIYWFPFWVSITFYGLFSYASHSTYTQQFTFWDWIFLPPEIQAIEKLAEEFRALRIEAWISITSLPSFWYICHLFQVNTNVLNRWNWILTSMNWILQAFVWSCKTDFNSLKGYHFGHVKVYAFVEIKWRCVKKRYLCLIKSMTVNDRTFNHETLFYRFF